MSLRILRPAVSLAAVALATVSLAACGSSSPESSTNSTPTASTPGAPGQVPGGFDMTAIQKCLSAAGISTPSGMPTGTSSGMPSGGPSGMPSGGPSGMPSGGPMGMGGQLNDPKVQAALKACGISMPGAPPTK